MVKPAVSPTKVAKTAPIIPASENTPKPAPPPALALRDRTQGHVRLVSESVLCPSVAPQLNSRSGLVFVLDISGSMYERFGDTTRLALGRQLLARQINALKDGTPFALVVYGETALRSGPLVPANDETRSAAIQFLEQEFDCGGGTNLPAGLALAGELQVGAVVVVTDGDLNMDAAELLPKAEQTLGAGNLATALTIVAVGPRPQTEAERLLHELAHQQGGTYVSYEDSAETSDESAARTPNLAAR